MSLYFIAYFAFYSEVPNWTFLTELYLDVDF